ncbi:MAG: hypothetical protein NTW19_11025 [Planctomycetota bacterium]|nr:hypothetical protein [Planctomycetota bacterium]
MDQWLRYDKQFCEALAGNEKAAKLHALDKAARFYRVSRNAPIKYESEKNTPRYGPVLEIIDSVQAADLIQNPVGQVIEIQDRISSQYGNRWMLSLTTKFLWLKVKQPIVIYDSLVRESLETKDRDYHTYFRKWRSKFESDKSEIIAASSRLSDTCDRVIEKCKISKDYVNQISGETWFHERVLDIRLWHRHTAKP